MYNLSLIRLDSLKTGIFKSDGNKEGGCHDENEHVFIQIFVLIMPFFLSLTLINCK